MSVEIYATLGEPHEIAATLSDLRYLVFQGLKGDPGADGVSFVSAYLDEGVVRYANAYGEHDADDIYTASAMAQDIDNGVLPLVYYSPEDNVFDYFELDRYDISGATWVVYFRSKDYLLSVDSTGAYTLTDRLQSGYDFVTPEQFGAVGDGVTDDSTAINNAINYAMNNGLPRLVAKRGAVYGVASPIMLNGSKVKVTLDFNDASVKAIAPIDEVFYIDTASKTWNQMRNVYIDCNGLAEYGIYDKYSSTFHFLHIYIVNFTNTALYIKQGNCVVHDMYINWTLNTVGAYPIGIQNDGTDSKFHNVTMRNCKVGVYNKGGLTFYTNIHPWIASGDILRNSVGFWINAEASLTSCYADTFETAIRIDGQKPLSLQDFHVFINRNFYTAEVMGATAVPKVFELMSTAQGRAVYPDAAYVLTINGMHLNMTLPEGFSDIAHFSNVLPDEFAASMKACEGLSSIYYNEARVSGVPKKLQSLFALNPSAYPNVEAIGSTFRFNDGGEKLPLLKCGIDIPITQSGTGDPALDNVRPFVGANTLTITQNSVNHFDFSKVVGSNATIRGNSKKFYVTSTSGGYNRALFDASDFVGQGVFYLSFNAKRTHGSLNDVAVSGTYKINGQTKYDAVTGGTGYIDDQIAATDLVVEFPEGATDAYLSFFINNSGTEVSGGISGCFEDVVISKDGDGVPITIDLGGTRYVCSLNVLTGELTVTHEYISFSDAAGWEYKSATLGGVWSHSISPKYPKATVSMGERAYCDRLPIAYRGGGYNDVLVNGLTVYTGNNSAYQFYLCPENRTITTAEQLGAWLSSNPVSVVYMLETPITIQLDPKQIFTTRGFNQFSVSSGELSVEYLADVGYNIAEQIRKESESISIPSKVSDLTNDSNFQTATQVQSAIAAAAELPSVAASDNGKFLRVVNGAWAAATVQTWQGGSY